jgi:hypothetical protein
LKEEEHQDQEEEEDQSLWSNSNRIEGGETLPHETKVQGKGIAHRFLGNNSSKFKGGGATFGEQ